MSARRRPRYCACVIAVVVASTTACAGHSTKPKATPAPPLAGLFPAEQAWIQDLDQVATSSATADNARLYLPVADHIRAFDRETGDTAWTADVVTRWPLALLGGSIYALTSDSIVELDSTSGATRRRVPLPAAPSAGMAWSADTLVVPLASSDLLAWRISEWRQVWTLKLSAPMAVPPAIAGDTIVAALDNSQVTALQLSDGKERWTATIAGKPQEIVATRGLAVVASSDRVIYALKAASGAFAWTRPSALDVVGMLLDDARVYVVDLDNTVRAYDYGGGPKWKKVVDTRVTAAPRLTTNGILIAGSDSTLRLLEIKRGTPLGTYSLPELAVVRMPPVVFADAGADHVEAIVITQDALLGLKRKPPPPKEALDANPKSTADSTPAAAEPTPSK